MAEKIKVSIIVPVYNVETYLDECLNSLAKQTIKEIEIICVNDGSRDSSLKIIKKYAKNDSRFIIINKNNSGYGDSMNKGLRKASGEYIGIVESDDFVDKNMFKTLYNLAKREDAEVVKSNAYFYWTDTNKTSLMKIVDDTNLNKIFCPTEEGLSIFYKIPSIWSAIYKKTFLEKNNIHFLNTPGASYQDTSFTFKVWLSAKRVYFTDKAFLYYRQDNANSSMNNIIKKASAIWKEFDEIETYARKKNPSLMPMIYERKFIHSYNFLLHMSGIDILNFSKEISYNLSNSSTNRTAFQSSKQYLRFLLIKNSPTFFFLIKCIHLLLNKIIRLAHRFTPWIDRKYYISLLKKDLAEREKYPGPKHDFGIQDKVSDQKISIIVPTCNDGVLIKKCIKSLVEQTYKNLEIIIVNDGTDEKSRKILNKIKEIDKRIIVVDSNHSGVATARNIGLKQATAPFIMWCDSDDFFYPTTCEDMLKNLLYSGTDFATCETNVIYEQGLSRNLKQGVDDYLNLKFTGRQTLNKTIITKTDASLWNKIYKKEIIDRHNISFPDGLYFEDALFNDIYMINSKTAFYLNKTLYNYLRKSNSVMSQTFKKSGISLDYCTIAQLLFKYLKENSLLEENRDFFWMRFCQYNYFAFSHMQQKDIKKKRVELKNFINKNKQELIDTNKWIKKEVKIVLRGTYKPIMIWRNIKNYLRTVLTKLDLSKSSQEKQIEYLERKIREKIKS